MAAPNPDPAAAPPARGQRVPARSRRLRGVAAAAGATVGLYLVLRHLAGAAATGAPVLPWLAPPVALLASGGAAMSALAAEHGWALIAALCSAATVAAFVTARRQRGRRDLATILFCSFAALTLAFAAMQRPVPAVLAAVAAGAALLLHGPDGDAASSRPRRALVLVPLALGFALRVANLTGKPPGYAEHAAVHHAQLSIPLHDDLRLGLLHADRAALHRIWNRVVTDQHGPDSLVEALGLWTFGVNMTATRLTSAVLGTLTILLAYGVGSRLAGPRAGLIFALLLAVVPWHVSISRYEDTEHVLSPLQALATFYFLLGTIRRGRWRDFLGLGAALGLSWYLYSPNQTLPLIAAAVVLVALQAGRGWLAGKTTRALIAAACFLVVSVPAVGDFVHRGRALPVRSSYEDDVSSAFLSPTRLARMATSELQQLFVRADDPWFGKPGGGLSLVAAALLLPGLAWCASRLGRREDRPTAALFLVGLPVAALPAVLAPDPSFRRLILFVLLALLLSALVLDRVLGRLLAEVKPRAIVVGAAALLGVVGVATSAHAYFDLTHAYETESHRYHEEMARFVGARLGSRYVTVVAAHDWDVDDVNRYLAIAAYDTLSGLAKRGVATKTVYRVVKAGELAAAMASPPTVAGRGLLLAEQFFVREPFEGVDLRALVARDLPGARASVWHLGDGTELFTWWEYEVPLGAAHD
ncbi:MAG: glycosyltransferase family 39 protein [Thermoanaerobaculaceae bacterium]|nr:glycosyltransferase family 39 protein [Thermoanaerobaculaceae bacterium]